MPNPAAAPGAGRTGPPWTAQGTVYFYGGPLSNFAPTPGLMLPFGYHGHFENDRVPVATVEHWFQACKATSRQQFDVILASGTARDRQARRPSDRAATRLGARQVPGDAVRAARQVRPRALPLGAAAHVTRTRWPRTAPTTTSGAAATRSGGHTGQNLLGLALMQVRDELVADVRTRLRALAPAVSPAQAARHPLTRDVQPRLAGDRRPQPTPRTAAAPVPRGARRSSVSPA